jgi:hypothetical protein
VKFKHFWLVAEAIKCLEPLVQPIWYLTIVRDDKRLDSSGSGERPVIGFYEHGNEPSRPISGA